MSATFWCYEAPRHRVERPCVFPGCCAEDRCGYCEDGIETDEVSESPEFNLSGANTRALLRAVGLEEQGCCGGLDPSEFPEVRRHIVRALSQTGARAPHLREDVEYVSPVRTEVVHEGNLARIEQRGGVQVVECGLSDDALCHRLRLFDRLLAYAQEHDYAISWG